MVCTDGTNDAFWAMNDGYGEIVVGDQGAAALISGSDATILEPGKPVERMKDPASAVLELIKRGATSFEGMPRRLSPPTDASTSAGKIWDGPDVAASSGWTGLARHARRAVPAVHGT